MLADAVSVGAKAISFIAIFQAAGMAMFLAILAGPLTEDTRALLRRTLLRSACVAAAFAMLHYLLEAGRMGGSLAAIADISLQKMALHSSAAIALGLRVIGLLLIGISALFPRANGAFAALPGIVLTLFAFTQTGHTSLDDAPPILPIVLFIHLLIVAFWFGALIPLRGISLVEPPAVSAAVIERFSAIAVWVVPMAFVAGALLTALLAGSFRALATSYGLIILTKAALFGGLMLMAARNKWYYGPAIRRGEAAARRGFQRTVAAEYGVISVVLMLTAGLTTFLSPDS